MDIITRWNEIDIYVMYGFASLWYNMTKDNQLGLMMIKISRCAFYAFVLEVPICD